MKKSTKIKLIVLGVIVLGFLIAIFMMIGTSGFRNSKTTDLNDEKVKFTQTLNAKLTAEGATEVNIADCTYFAWDEAYIFEPYYSAKDAYKTAGCEWTRTQWYYQYIFTHGSENKTVNDSQRLIVFKSEGKAVASGVVEVNIAKYGEDGYIKLTPSDCTFKIDTENANALVYQPAQTQEEAA